jgi:outer membrane protein
VKNRIVGIVLAALMVVSVASVSTAAEDFKRWSAGLQLMYINPDVDVADLSVLDAEPAITGGLTVEYFFTPSISAELVAAVAKHDLEIADQNLGSLWILPPSLYAKYHFMPKSKISPYIGVGVNWVKAWDEKLYLPGVGSLDVDVEDSFGWAAKAGADIQVSENLYLNVDVMYLSVETELNVKAGGASVLSGSDIDIDPWVYSIGAKYRF